MHFQLSYIWTGKLQSYKWMGWVGKLFVELFYEHFAVLIMRKVPFGVVGVHRIYMSLNGSPDSTNLVSFQPLT